MIMMPPRTTIEMAVIRIIAGGKKRVAWCAEACAEYGMRLRKPFDVRCEFLEEDKLADGEIKGLPFFGERVCNLLR